MKLVTFTRDAQQKPGALTANGVVDLAARMHLASVREILAARRLKEAEQIAASAQADFAAHEIQLALPIPDPPKILCVGVNYVNRNEEYKDNSDAPKFPSLFLRTPLSLVPHGEPLIIPRESPQLDYEGEIVLVIGKSGRRIPPDRALDHVAGLTIMNEGSVRDWMRHGKFNVTQGKNFDRSGALGPSIETQLPESDLRIETRVNGELRQSDTTASMLFPFARIIEYISTFTTLEPGDLIATGTPTGAGARFDPPRWLREGDVVEITVESVGTLRNPVIAE
jgi:2-keto-4-pentenoate hydratase/2-oxohepta-3-ene-1,7-dioic acid hydratase in catechol pathway